MNISYIWAVFIIGIAVLAYLLLGGFKAVIKTDFFRFPELLCLILFLIWLNILESVWRVEFISTVFSPR